MDAVRINCAYGTHKDYRKIIRYVREVEEELGITLSVLMDLTGPKIRVGKFKKGMIHLKRGQLLSFTEHPIEGDESKVSINLPGFSKLVFPGSRILLKDGAVELKVIGIEPPGTVVTQVVTGEEISSFNGVNLPDTPLDVPPLTDKDKSDLRFGLSEGADWFALSFVRKEEDIEEILQIMEGDGVRKPVIAKIEKPEALKNIDKIIEKFDGCMIARGDLGVEIPLEQVPAVQKSIIDRCNAMGKPVITATQMMESMIERSRPTRAEVADVANAIYDGTDCVMLSGETAVGKYPVLTVSTMNRIIKETESKIDYRALFRKRESRRVIADAISHVTCQSAYDVNAKAIVTMTHTGSTARMVARYRPASPLFALTPFKSTMRQINLIWGVIPIQIKTSGSTDEMFEIAEQILKKKEIAKKGDIIVISAGVPIGTPGTTNLLKIQKVR